MERIEQVVVTGEFGVLTAINGTVSFDVHKQANMTIRPLSTFVQDHLSEVVDADTDIVGLMFRSFLEHCDGGSNASSNAFWDLKHHMRITRLIQNVYEAADSQSLGVHHRRAETAPHFQWPLITKDVENAVMTQLHTSISIYDQNGVFGEFEDAFKRFHDCPDWYALLHNSGTNALHALFLACGAKPGDEVSCNIILTCGCAVNPLLLL